MSGLAVQLPLAIDRENGFALLKNIKDLIQQNLRTLITTSPGEKIGDPEYGVGVRQLLFSQSRSQAYSSFESRLGFQVGAYMPFIELVRVQAVDTEDNERSNTLYTRVEYRIISLDVLDVLELEINI